MFDDIRNNLEINVVGAVDDAIPHSSHTLPGDIRISLVEIIRQTFSRFTNNFQGAYNRKVDPEIGFELGIAYPFEQSLRLVHAI